MHQCVSLSIRAVAVSSETYDPEFRNVPGIYTLELRGSAKVGNLGTLSRCQISESEVEESEWCPFLDPPRPK